MAVCDPDGENNLTSVCRLGMIHNDATCYNVYI